MSTSPAVLWTEDETTLPLTIHINNYNGMKVLPETLGGLRRLNRPNLSIVMVDDGSTDGSIAWVRENYPEVRVVSMGRNTHNVNMVRNRGLREAATRYVVILDNDILVLPGCLEQLLSVMRSRERVLCCTPRLMYLDEPDLIYHDGGGLSYLCVSLDAGQGCRVQERPVGEPRPTLSGGIMLLDRESVAEVGFFDEDYRWGWGDDGDFHMRGRLQGYQVLHVPAAQCLHVERPHGADRVFAQFYNRYRLMYLNYSWRTLGVLAPALLMFEVILTGFALMKGCLGARCGAVWQFAAEWPRLRKRRAEIQARRRVADRQILESGPLGLSGAVNGSDLVRRVTRLWDGLFAGYWFLARPLLAREPRATGSGSSPGNRPGPAGEPQPIR